MIDTSVGIIGAAGIKRPEYHASLGDILPRGTRSGRLHSLTVTLRKDVDNMIDFSISSRAVTLWERLVISWNGKSWISDYSLFKEVEGKQVYLKRIREDFPYLRKAAQRDVAGPRLD
jgi:hypothetical protein